MVKLPTEDVIVALYLMTEYGEPEDSSKSNKFHRTQLGGYNWWLPSNFKNNRYLKPLKNNSRLYDVYRQRTRLQEWFNIESIERTEDSRGRPCSIVAIRLPDFSKKENRILLESFCSLAKLGVISGYYKNMYGEKRSDEINVLIDHIIQHYELKNFSTTEKRFKDYFVLRALTDCLASTIPTENLNAIYETRLKQTGRVDYLVTDICKDEYSSKIMGKINQALLSKHNKEELDSL